jgi:rSAM/selenodomain-associated transferase 1
MMPRTLILFARVPRLGGGKSRLARDIGAVAALRFERLMLARYLRRFGRDRRWRLRLALTPDREARRLGAMPQGRGDLGVRMRRAMAACKPGPVALIGTDIPALNSTYIATAFVILNKYDLVFGPAKDGGFWLVGARRRMPEFGEVRWSSPYALSDTLANLPKALSVGFAATLDDVDDGAAYRRAGMPRGF